MAQACFRRICALRRCQNVYKLIMDFFVDTLIGILCGAIAGMGLGGGSVLIIFLTLFRSFEQTVAQGINLLFFFPSALSSLPMHIKNGFIEKKLFLRCALIGVFSAVAGSLIAAFIDVAMLKKAFALLLFYVGIQELFKK